MRATYVLVMRFIFSALGRHNLEIRDSFEGNTAIFLAVRRAAGLPGTSA